MAAGVDMDTAGWSYYDLKYFFSLLFFHFGRPQPGKCHTVSCLVRDRGQNSRGVKLTTHPQLPSRLRCGVYLHSARYSRLHGMLVYMFTSALCESGCQGLLRRVYIVFVEKVGFMIPCSLCSLFTSCLYVCLVHPCHEDDWAVAV